MPAADRTGLTWRKSSYSNESGEDCVEVAELGVGAAVRDSKAPGAGHLTMSRASWRAFLTSAAFPLP
ncbi:DUF397 domain-containing protein [Amycolatopsis sp. CA-230715]|uniref:DUF397 domain-containing protein n=1 Tax=Amycolatopsis sp. CA-230715 TaxID=2745196 RepID=UPI001C01397F|nr:DUF397 domain-containing protein [Amycolatopsis sp. CA-230715]QWF80061.1 hypothetical protein HUW46_03476 [Amycolatopsis sp. CA-230715]